MFGFSALPASAPATLCAAASTARDAENEVPELDYFDPLSGCNSLMSDLRAQPCPKGFLLSRHGSIFHVVYNSDRVIICQMENRRVSVDRSLLSCH